MMENMKYDQSGREYTERVYSEKSYILEVELNHLMTSRPEKPLKIYIDTKLVFDSVDAYYNLKPVKYPIGPVKDIIDVPLMFF